MYYRINHKKKFLFYDKVSLANIKSGFFYELSSKNDPLIDNNIIHLFNFLLKDYLLKSTEKLYLIYTLIEEFKRMKNIQLENYDKISINISRKIIKKNYKMNFDFLSEDLDDICTLISLGFTKIFSTKKIKFKSYEELLKKLEEYNTFFFDVVKIYKTYKFSVPPNAPEIPKGDVPNEILLLKYIFQGIKQLNLNLKNMAKNNILPFLIIILNFDWLFPFVFDVDIDLRYEQLQNDIDNYYFTKEKIFYANYLKNKQTSDDYLYDFDEDNEEKEMEKEIKFNGTEKEIQIIDLIKNDFNKVSNYTNEKKLLNNISEMNSNLNLENIIDGNYINLLIKNENVFDVILCFFYSIKKIKYLKSLNITMPNGFIKENIDLIKIRSIPHNALVDISNINLFEYITPISSVNSFSISFNFLEKKTFENVLFIIQNNSDLREIKLNFFDSYNLNSYNLMKIYQECGVFTSNDIFRNETKIIMNKRIEKIIKQKLLQYLELNLEKLFLLIQTKKSLERLEIIIKLPSKLLESGNENDGYHIAIMKFIINLIILLNSEKLYLKEFKLILPFFNFDNRAYPIIGEVFDKMNLQVEIQTAYSEETVFIELVGEDIGVLIGKRGQTLDSLQYLTSLVVNKGREEYIRIKMDSENYRDRRQKTIENLAKNLAKKAKNTGRVVHVDAMNPYERRIIHSVLQEDKYVDTHSEGEEPNRHVVITLTEEYANMPRKPRGKYNNRRGGYNRGYKKDGYRKNGRYGKRSDSYQNDYKDNNSNHEKGESSEEATE